MLPLGAKAGSGLLGAKAEEQRQNDHDGTALTMLTRRPYPKPVGSKAVTWLHGDWPVPASPPAAPRFRGEGARSRRYWLSMPHPIPVHPVPVPAAASRYLRSCQRASPPYPTAPSHASWGRRGLREREREEERERASLRERERERGREREREGGSTPQQHGAARSQRPCRQAPAFGHGFMV